MRLLIDLMDPLPGSRLLDATHVENLAESIRQTGLRHAPTVIKRGDRFVIVSGNSRTAAMQLNGEKHIEVEVLPEETPPEQLIKISMHENYVRLDEGLAAIIDRLSALMKLYRCDFEKALAIAKVKGPDASKIRTAMKHLSPEAMSFAQKHKIGLTIVYEVARRAKDPTTQLDWLRKSEAGEMTRSDICEHKPDRQNRRTKSIKLTFMRGDISIVLTMPKTIDYPTLKDTLAGLSAQVEGQRKRNTPADLLPRFIGEQAEHATARKEVVTCSV